VTPAILAGDLGGTKCRFALIDDEFGVHCVEHFETVRDRSAFLATFDRTIERVLDDVPAGLERPSVASFGIAGVIPEAGGVVDHATNLPLDGYALAPHVQDRFGLETVLINDGWASAWGEYLRGHAAGRDPLLCLFFGTGIGIGLMAGGKPYSGSRNAAGEVGHTTFRPGGRRCPCGKRGHFEAYCGGRAITERAAEVLGAVAGSDLTVGSVVAAARTEPRLRDILEDAALAACVLVENLCTVLNPGAVVLGGGVLAGWPELRQRIETHVRENTNSLIQQDMLFVPSMGGSDAILWGAAAATGSLSL